MTPTTLLRILAGLAIILAAPAARAEDPCTVPARTASGLVRGQAGPGSTTCVWRGIPYAAAPVGELRWAAPRPAPAWDGVRETVAFGDQCMQEGLLPGSKGPEHMSEDCLFLNIWRPQKSGPFPVMVWIHGGGYYSGGSNVYPGVHLSETGDMVVVTINYRLNIFGFMATAALRDEDPDHATGGYGSLDQVFALQWVHDNIANFGGDPANVTIFGESAGGWSICTMLATPLARGLFHGAIMESGTCEASQSLDAGYATAARSAQALGCAANDTACMRRVPAEKLLLKGSAPLMEGFAYVPAVEGHLLKASPLEMIRSGDYNHVPFLAGTNQDEFAQATLTIPRFSLDPPWDYQRMLNRITGNQQEASELARLYPLSQFHHRPAKAIGRAFASDACLTCPTYQALRSLTEQGGTVWMYRFDYTGMWGGRWMGSFHAAEVPFVFGNLGPEPRPASSDHRNFEAMQRLSKIMMGHWIAFAKTGDPNGPGLPAWPKFVPPDPAIQVFDETVRSEPFGITARCDFWAGYSQSYLETINFLLDSLPVPDSHRLPDKPKP